MTAKVKPIPEGMHTLTPHLVCAGAAQAIDFYTRAFGATELMRMPGPDGRLMHASLKVGDSTLMLFDEMPEWGALGPKALKGSPVTIHMMVPDVDAAFARAVAAGATVKMPVADMFWGDRYGKLADPFGHEWAIATRILDLTPEQMIAAGRVAMARSPGCPDAPGSAPQTSAAQASVKQTSVTQTSATQASVTQAVPPRTPAAAKAARQKSVAKKPTKT